MFVDDVSLLNSIDVLYVANHGFSVVVRDDMKDKIYNV